MDELNKLDRYTLILKSDTNNIYFKDIGIKPMVDALNMNIDLSEFVAYDRLVGKAVAFLFLKANIKEVHTKVISKLAKDLFDKYNVKYTYIEEIEYVVNRKKDGQCPMESLVNDIDDVDIAYELLIKKYKELNNIN